MKAAAGVGTSRLPESRAGYCQAKGLWISETTIYWYREFCRTLDIEVIKSSKESTLQYLVDVTCVSIYFSLALLVLRGTLL